jgi:hypothetical protein
VVRLQRELDGVQVREGAHDEEPGSEGVHGGAGCVKNLAPIRNVDAFWPRQRRRVVCKLDGILDKGYIF